MQEQKGLNNLRNSLIATSLAEFVTTPVCTVKTLYQTGNQTPLSCVKNLYKQRGMIGFFYASPMSVSGQLVSTSSKYTFYREFQPCFQQNYPGLYGNILSGIIAGISGSLLSHPIDCVKIHRQLNMEFHIKNMYRGFLHGIPKTIVGGATWFPIYDYLRKDYSVSSAGFYTSILSVCISSPLDLLKVRKMAGVKQPFIRNIYKGFLLNMCRVVPHFIITMNVIETLKMNL